MTTEPELTQEELSAQQSTTDSGDNVHNKKPDSQLTPNTVPGQTAPRADRVGVAQSELPGDTTALHSRTPQANQLLAEQIDSVGIADAYDRLRAGWRNREQRNIDLNQSEGTFRQSCDSIKHLYESGLIDITEVNDHDTVLSKLAPHPGELEIYKTYMTALNDFQRDAREHKQRLDERLFALQQFNNTLSRKHGLKRIVLRRSPTGQGEALANGVRVLSEAELSSADNRQFSESLTRDVLSRLEFVQPLFYVTPEYDRKLLSKTRLDDLVDALENLKNEKWLNQFSQANEAGRIKIERQAADMEIQANRIRALCNSGLIDSARINDIKHIRQQLANHPEELKVYNDYAKILKSYQESIQEMNRRHDVQISDLQELITNYAKVFETPDIKVTRANRPSADESTFEENELTLSAKDLNDLDGIPRLIKRLLQKP